MLAFVIYWDTITDQGFEKVTDLQLNILLSRQHIPGRSVTGC